MGAGVTIIWPLLYHSCTFPEFAEQMNSIQFWYLSKWCEALSAFGPKCKKSPAEMSTSNFDLKHPSPDTFQCHLELCFQTPEANTNSTHEFYFQLQIFPGGVAVLEPSWEVACHVKHFSENCFFDNKCNPNDNFESRFWFSALKMVRSTLRGQAIMQKVTGPDRGFQFRAET